MKYVRKGWRIVIDKGLTDDSDLFDRLLHELARQDFNPVPRRSRNRAMLPRLTLEFGSPGEAFRAEKWIDDVFEV